MAEPTGAGAAPLALLWGLAAILVAAGGRPTVRRGVAAGALVALAAAWRPDFAAYAGAGAVVALAMGDGDRLRAGAACVGAGVGLSVLAYVPFAIAAGPGRLADRLVAVAFRDHDYWTLPFPLHYHGPLRGWPPGRVAGDLRDALRFYLPLLSLVGVAVVALAAGVRTLRRRRVSPVTGGLLVFAAGGVFYLRSRPDVVHVQVLVVMLAALLPIVAHRVRSPLRYLAAAVLLLIGLNAVANRVSAMVSPPALADISAPPADGVEAPPAEALALSRLVEVVDARVPPGDPIYVAPRRSDLIKLNDPLVYVLADRDNASGEDFGLLAGDAAQARIVRRLQRTRPRVVVRWTDPVSSRREPNLRGVSSGSRRLDAYLARRYRLLQRLYHYDVLVPRAP
jgi:hypothetical protein